MAMTVDEISVDDTESQLDSEGQLGPDSDLEEDLEAYTYVYTAVATRDPPETVFRSILQRTAAVFRACFSEHDGVPGALGKPLGTLIVDSGASMTATPHRSDFVGEVKPPSAFRRLKGIAKGLSIEGEGYVEYSFADTGGRLQTFRLPALYVPDLKARLLCTSSFAQCHKDREFSMDGSRVLIEKHRDWTGATPTPIEFPICPRSNLPVAPIFDPRKVKAEAVALSSTISPVSDSNRNLSNSAKELLRWHFRLGHLAFKKV